MLATISASVKFWPEMRTVPLSAEADEPVSLAVGLLLSELPQAVRSAALAATTPARSRRVFMWSHLLCPASRRDARVRCPRSRAWSDHHVLTTWAVRPEAGVS